MVAIDRQKLLAFLNEKADARSVNTTSGLVIASIYQGMVTRVISGEFDEEE